MKTQSGFILADTLIALTIVALMLTSLLSALQLLHAASTSSAHQLEARLIARALAFEEACPAREGNQKGEFVEYYWTCKEEIQRLENNDRIQVRSTILQLEWGRPDQKRTYELIQTNLEARES